MLSVLHLTVVIPSVNLPTEHVHFQDHNLVLGSLADFPAIFLQEFLTDKHLLCLSVLRQAQLTKLLPAQEKKDR